MTQQPEESGREEQTMAGFVEAVGWALMAASGVLLVWFSAGPDLQGRAMMRAAELVARLADDGLRPVAGRLYMAGARRVDDGHD